MSNKAQGILKALYEIDPALKKHEDELKRLIKKMLSSRPQAEPNAAFLEELRDQLVRQAHVLNEVHEEVQSKRSFGFVPFLNRFLYPFAGGVVAMLLIVTMVWQPGQVIIDGTPIQVKQSDITAIDDHVLAVNNGLKTCVKTVIELFGESTEGGSVALYVKNEQIQKIKEELLGETGKTVNFYYFKDTQLIQVVQERHEYNRPIYWDETMAEAFEDDEVFDPEKSVIVQNSFYFEDDILLQRVDENGEAITIAEDTSQLLRGNYFVQRSKELLQRLENGEGEVVENN